MNLNDFLLWILDLVQSVDPVVRTLLAGVGIFLETSLLIGLIVPGDTIVIAGGERSSTYSTSGDGSVSPPGPTMVA